MNRNTAIIAALVSMLAGMLLMHLVTPKLAPALAAPIVKDSASVTVERPKANAGAVRVELYVMSQCPYGVQAVNAIKPVADKLGNDIDLTIDYIGQGSSPSSLTSMHGPKEVAGDIAQLCAAKVAPSKYLDLIACQNKNYQNVEANWQSCASEAGIPADRLQSCIRGDEGK